MASLNMGRSGYSIDSYVTRADPQCKARGCQFAQASAILDQAGQAMNRHFGRNSMSQALWCDAGGHAFSERDPGRQRISVTVLDDNGNEQAEARDFCGSCAASAGLLGPRKTRPTLTAPADPPPADVRLS